VFREIRAQLQEMQEFSWERVEMTLREKSRRITASEFLQI